jgi:ParB family chromosome partitioning protein
MPVARATPTAAMPPGEPTPSSTSSAPTSRVAEEMPPAGLLELETVLGEYFATPVHVNMGRGRGRLSIDFADLEDLERIYRLIVHEP